MSLSWQSQLSTFVELGKPGTEGLTGLAPGADPNPAFEERDIQTREKMAAGGLGVLTGIAQGEDLESVPCCFGKRA